jgi:hypothetical protein
MHEQFCALSWADWRELVASVGLEIDERSGPWRNDWLVENRFAPAASLLGLDDEPLDWPDTHMLLVAPPARRLRRAGGRVGRRSRRGFGSGQQNRMPRAAASASVHPPNPLTGRAAARLLSARGG